MILCFFSEDRMIGIGIGLLAHVKKTIAYVNESGNLLVERVAFLKKRSFVLKD